MVVGVNLKHGVARAEYRSRCSAAILVVHEHGRRTGDHIVRVDVVDGEVVHGFVAGEVSDDGYPGLAAIDRCEVMAGAEGPGGSPLMISGVPDEMVLGGVQDAQLAFCLDCDVGETGVDIAVG